MCAVGHLKNDGAGLTLLITVSLTEVFAITAAVLKTKAENIIIFRRIAKSFI